MKDIVDALRQLTAEDGLNISGSIIAKYSGLSSSAVTNYIRGDSYPSISSEQKLVEGFERYKKELLEAMEYDKTDGVYYRKLQ